MIVVMKLRISVAFKNFKQKKKPCAILARLAGRVSNSVTCGLSLTAAVTRSRLPDMGAGEA